ncbi:hypothetical protein [Tenacibaculum discolor]|uniref:hypothetical protein n=1 Tax=Tenacibaculum discolor TaxID=361581 RepID=UPI000EB5B080|nr:hypothetical protein [Tenacibaculum discolor]
MESELLVTLLQPTTKPGENLPFEFTVVISSVKVTILNSSMFTTDGLVKFTLNNSPALVVMVFSKYKALLVTADEKEALYLNK